MTKNINYIFFKRVISLQKTGLATSRMSGSAENIHQVGLKEGFWKIGWFRVPGSFHANVLQTQGPDKLTFKNLVVLDYPHLDQEGSSVIECKFGNFGPARDEIKSASGVEEYNLHVKSGSMDIKGVLSADGTKITIWGFTNALEEWTWLDEEDLEKLKENRDDYEAPRYNNIF